MTSPRLPLNGLRPTVRHDVRGYDRNTVVLAAALVWVVLVALGLALTFS